ncbi:MAG: hypothetical protein RID15_16415 [Marinovum algicola]|jgi:hypothetical protein|uniref:hypothetical protein n=1 Tax=Marinovum TaxID=367771 RepID=UPI00065B1366|nr:hypothetical protein MALG_02238 [Marinovum algicola DG 898]
MREPQLPKLVRQYFKHVLIGFLASAVFVVMLLGFNIANLAHLVATSPLGILAVFLLWVVNGIVFAGVQFGISTMGDDDDDTPGGGLRAPVREYAPVRVPVAKPRRRI